MTKFFCYLLAILMITSSCKSLQKPTKTVETKPITTAENTLALAHENAAFTAKTLEAKLETQYDDGEQQQNITIKLRIEKDKVIWMSGTFVGIPMAKILITPDRIQYFEKINKTYYDGDFTLFQKYFGVALSFEQIQNLLLGQAFFGTKDTQISPNSSLSLVPIVQHDKFDLFYFINPQHFKLDSQQVVLPNDETLNIQYSNYQTIDNQLIPSQIKVLSNQSNHQVKIDFNIKNVILNQNLSFPFEMPQGYERLDFSK